MHNLLCFAQHLVYNHSISHFIGHITLGFMDLVFIRSCSISWASAFLGHFLDIYWTIQALAHHISSNYGHIKAKHIHFMVTSKQSKALLSLYNHGKFKKQSKAKQRYFALLCWVQSNPSTSGAEELEPWTIFHVMVTANPRFSKAKQRYFALLCLSQTKLCFA